MGKKKTKIKNKALTYQSLGFDDSIIDVLRDNQSEMSEVTYYTCIKMLSEAIAKLPLKFYQMTPGGIVPAGMTDTFRVLSLRPNPYMTPTTFWTTMEMNCQHYGTPSAQVPAYEEKTKYNGDSDSDIIIYPNVCYGPIIETQNLSVIEYSVKAYQDPTIKLGTNISIYLDNSKYIKSRIISRTLTFVSDRAIIAEYSANSAPYNNCTYSDDKYKTFTADMEKTKKALPTVACGGSVYKLKTCKVLSKEEYDALTEKRTDTLYYVIEPES